MRKFFVILVAGVMLSSGLEAKGEVVRATELAKSGWLQFGGAGVKRDTTVEFRQGDELPVTADAEGDLVETSRPATSYVRVKRDFWLRYSEQGVFMSLDGETYKPVQEMIKGQLSIGHATDGSGVASGIQILLKSELK